MALDIGGGALRCALLNVRTGSLDIEAVPAHVTPCAKTHGLGFDCNADATLAALGAASKALLERVGVGPTEVAAVACSSMRQGSVFLGADGAVLLAAPNRDARAAAEALELASEFGEEIYAQSGRWPYPIFPAARLLWFLRQSGSASVRHCLALNEWVAWKLCGSMASDPTQAGETLLSRLASRDWNTQLMERLGIPPTLFPPVAQPGERLGLLGTAGAQLLGLLVGTPVAVGASDTACGILGAGAIEVGEAAAITGTSAPVQIVTDEPLLDPNQRTWTGQHPLAGRWVVESNAGPMGEALAWFAGMMFADSPCPIARLFAEATKTTPGVGGTVSSIGADVFDAKQLSCPPGYIALGHMASQHDPLLGRRFTARAVVDGAASAVRANLEQAECVAGKSARVLRLGGGMLRARSWGGLVATLVDHPVELAGTHHTTALGTALLAGVAAGAFEDLQAAGSQAASWTTRVDPNVAQHAQMQSMYAGWQRARQSRDGADCVASELATPFVLRANDEASQVASLSYHPRILVTADMDASALAQLGSLGVVEYASFRDRSRLLVGTALIEALEDVDVFITEIDLVDATVLLGAPGLKVIGTCRGDPVNIDFAACDAAGIPVLNAPGRNAHAVADLTLAFFLMLLRNFSEAGQFLRIPGGRPGDMGRMGHAFSKFRGHEMGKAVVGLVGLGAVGREVALRASACGAKVLASDPYVSEEDAAILGVQLVDFETLLVSSDLVSLHAPVSAATRGLMGEAQFARMKPGASFVNTARAALVDEAALKNALDSGHLGGAALDVFAEEPPGADHALLQLENVIATPHIAGNTYEVAGHQGRMIAEDLRRLLLGQKPFHALNPQSVEGLRWEGSRSARQNEALRSMEKTSRVAVSDLQVEAGASEGNPRVDLKDAHAESRTTAATAPKQSAKARVFVEVLEAFVQGIAHDAVLAELGKGAQVTLQFLVTDLATGLYFRLGGDPVEAALGEPSAQAEVELRLTAAVLDGMFRGTLNPMEAAMDGRLSFTGDAAKAMTLSRIEGELQRLYQAALVCVGDPGEWTAMDDDLTDPSSPPPAARPSAVGARAQARPRKEEDHEASLAAELVRVVGELYAAELITATGGNVSVRRADGSFWITPSQLFKGALAPDQLVAVDHEGRPMDNGARSPSSESLMHLALFAAKPQARAVIHCHAKNATILANSDLPFLAISTEAAFFSDIPRVPFIMPGTVELAEAVGSAVGDGWAVLLKNHGLIVAGRTLRRAADMAEIIERSAEVMLGCWSVGKTPPVLPEAVLGQLREIGDLIA